MIDIGVDFPFFYLIHRLMIDQPECSYLDDGQPIDKIAGLSLFKIRKIIEKAIASSLQRATTFLGSKCEL